jgi:hypothetical protein
MVYQNHMLEMLIKCKRWMAIDIHMDHSSPLRKKWSPLCQVPSGDGETFVESESWLVACLVEVDVLLVIFIWRDVMNMLEVLDPFERYGYMIFLVLSVGGLCQ